MRHLKAGRTLSRTATHRLAMFRNMTRSLLEHGQITTTLPKAKELRPFVEKLITLAKEGTLHARRRAISRLADKDAVRVLFQDIAPRFADRNGGYTRVLRLSGVRLGDAGQKAIIQLLKAGETKERRETKPEPVAPKVAE
ncbi:MAG: 50S ribosomal protein L17 [Gemmataceae bacterium]|jgi:large subunit ribosomal protein L17|nr:50S ribosomal protein L17 [Gemmataceae bacterium]